MEMKDLFLAMPLLFVGGGILLILLVDMFLPDGKKLVPTLTFFVLIITAYYSLFTINQVPRALAAVSEYGLFYGMLSYGGKTHLFYFLFNFGSAIAVLIAHDYLKKIETEYSEYYILLLSSVLGMMLMVSSRSLVMIFIGLEQMSIPFYALAGYRRKNILSNEAALKYFLLGSFATGFLVYGMALIFGSAQSIMLVDIFSRTAFLVKNPLFMIGMLLFFTGFTFKIAAGPFHMWAPDVYEGSPTSVTALMATVGKAAAFSAILLMFVTVAKMGTNSVFSSLFSVVAVLSMVYGSIVAISQRDFKRMLAYSSIAHAGYMVIGLASVNLSGIAGIIFYLIAYTFMNLGAFGIIALLESKEGKFLSIEDYKGLGTRQPFLAASLAIIMFALSGIPPFVGFFGKYYIFLSAVQSGNTWLALVGILSSVISVYFYLRIVVYMYFTKSEDESDIGELSQTGLLSVIASVILVIALGISPGSLIRLINSLIY